MVEAMMALTLVDHLMMHKAQCELFPNEAELKSQLNPMGKTAKRTAETRRQTVEVTGAGYMGQRIDEE